MSEAREDSASASWLSCAASISAFLRSERLKPQSHSSDHVGLLRVGRAVAPFADVGGVRRVPRERVVVGLGLVLVEDLAHARRPLRDAHT